MKRSIARELRTRLTATGLLGSGGLLAFVAFDVDRIFDRHYKQTSGLAYEIADHVILPLIVFLVPVLVLLPHAVRRSLKPLEQAADRINAADGKERGFRVTPEGLPAEAVPFVEAINNLLVRLDDAAERQEAFAADIAHELKTPLAVLRLELEQYGDPLGTKIRHDIGAMNRLVDQLLLIAQLDADQSSRVSSTAIRLREVASEVCARLAPAAIRDGRRLELEVADDVVIDGRREAIAAALRNLVENALRATPSGEAVRVIVGPGPELRVEDRGPGLTPERLAALSRRLHRADHASLDGAGLGLSIVTKIMESHRGRLETDPVRRELRMVFQSCSGLPPLPRTASPPGAHPGEAWRDAG